MKTMRKIITGLFFLLLFALTITWQLCRYYKSERDRLSDNQRTLLSSIDFYRTKDSLSAAGVERLTLSCREFKKYYSDLGKTIEGLNLKIKRLRSVSQTATEAQYKIKTETRDSVIGMPGRIDTLRCIDFRNGYLTLSGCIEGRQFSGIIQSRDTLIQVVHRVPRKFWFIRWGTKAIRQEIVSRNPYSRITYMEYIELKK